MGENVFKQKLGLLIKRLSDLRWRLIVLSFEARGVEELHERVFGLLLFFFLLLFLCSDSTASSAVEKGPENCPF